MRYVDWDGNELSLEEWGARHQDFAGRKLGSEVVDGRQVITLWHGFGPDFMPDAPAQVFGTAYSGRSGQLRQIRTYRDRATAVLGHDLAEAALRLNPLQPDFSGLPGDP